MIKLRSCFTCTHKGKNKIGFKLLFHIIFVRYQVHSCRYSEADKMQQEIMDEINRENIIFVSGER